jgi:D-beta-D-heptose 7-phosphate kinase/D-beta-D-heptose 1-phosphate adenosyltransferase
VTLRGARARRLLRAMAGRRVLVVGDLMLDEFLWGSVARISPEAPVPVVAVERHSDHAGGAGNVAANVRALGGAATLLAVVGKDAAAERLQEQLASAGIEASLASADGERPTTVKTRIIAHQQQVVRADREKSDPIPRALEDDLLARLSHALPGTHALVVSDYRKGVVTPRVMRALVRAARARRLPLLVDPKVQQLRLYRGCDVVTPNQLEAEQATGIRIRGARELAAAGARILSLLGCRAALVTRGEHGMTLFQRGRRPLQIDASAREIYDVTGAGDTVIATLALALAARAPLPLAAALANHAAGVVVGKLGTATVAPDELLAALAG